MRAYDSTRRLASAEERRRRILETARALFNQDGVGATTIERIAQGAAVAVPTVYAMFPSKSALVLGLFEVAFEYHNAKALVLERDLDAAVKAPRKQLRRIVSFYCDLYAHTADIYEIVRGSMGTDAAILAAWREIENQRFLGYKTLTTAWRRAGALREGVDENYAHDVLWMLTSAEQHRLFVVERERSVTGLGIWLEETLEPFLFPPLRRRHRGKGGN